MKISFVNNGIFEKLDDINFVICKSFQSIEEISKIFKNSLLSDGKRILDNSDLPIPKENIDFWLVKWDVNSKKEFSIGNESLFSKDISQWMIDNNFEELIKEGIEKLQKKLILYLEERQIDFIKIGINNDYQQEPEKTLKNYLSFSFNDEINGFQNFKYILIRYLINKFSLSINEHKIIIIESAEMLADEQIIKIKNEAIKNKVKLVFITSNPELINKNFSGQLFYEEDSNKIRKWEISKNLIYEYIAMYNFDEKKFSDYAIYYHDITKVVTDQDLNKEKQVICQKISPFISELLLSKKIKNSENFNKLFCLFLELILKTI